MNGTAKNLGELEKESNCEKNQERVPSEIGITQIKSELLPNNSNFSISMRQILGSWRKSRITLTITQVEIGQANVLSITIQILGGDRIKINDNICDLTPEIYNSFSATSNNGKTTKNESDFLMMNNIIRGLGYSGIGDKSSKRIFLRLHFLN